MLARVFHLRLTGRFVLMVACISLLGVAVAGVAYRLVSGPAFQQLIVDEGAERFTGNVTLYYRESGGVDGIKEWLAPRVNQPPISDAEAAREVALHPQDPLPGGLVHFGLANPAGVVVLKGRGDYPEGDTLSPAVLAQGKPIFVDGNRIGTILVPATVPRTRSQQIYVGRIGVALAWAAGIGILVAGIAGFFFSRGIVKPVKQLTVAARGLARDRRGQAIPIQGHDEVAELTASFNEMSADLARYEQARQQMVADIAHELRTPLTTISGYVEAIRDGELAPTVERLDSVFLQTQRLGRVIDDLRLLSMADVGALPLERAPICVRELVVQSVRAYQVKASRNGVDLRAEVDDGVPAVHADPGRIQQVIEILVNNALRHTQRGEVVVSAVLEGEEAAIRVADTGSGIEPEALPRLFDRFFRGDEAQELDGHGAGLGLAIAQAIVKAHHGTIAVASQLTKGTVFTVRLPAATAAA